MSQLRKSASFRSRIPVRRNRFAHRRCCSPQPTFFGDSVAVGRSCGCVPHYKLRTNRSFAFEGNPKQPSQHYNYRYNNRHHKLRPRHCIEQGCSSSSYSSSDESCESEAAHQKFVRQSRETPTEHTLYVSTDALSLDGLLDSVSCGSFSSPPSPVHYQNTEAPYFHRCASYESLEKYNIALESFQISDEPQFLAFPLSANVGSSQKENFMIHCTGSNKNNYSFNKNNNNNNYRSSSHNKNDNKQEQKFVVNNKLTTATTTTSREARQPSAIKTLATAKTTTATATTMATKSSEIVGASKDEASKKSFYIEKQKQLSDWYYIKTKKDVVVIEDNNVDDNDVGVDADGGNGDGESDGIIGKETDVQSYDNAQKTKNLLSPNLKNFVLFDRIEALCSGAQEQTNDECKQQKINYDENFTAQNSNDETTVTTNDSLFLEHEYVNSIRHHQQQQQQQHGASAIKSSQLVAGSLPATTTKATSTPAIRHTRYTTDATTTTCESQPFKWNNFDQQQLKPTAYTQPQQQHQQQQQSNNITCCYQRETANYNDTIGDMEVEYNEAVDALNRRKPNCPPYYCPPNYTAHQSYAKESQQQQQKPHNSNFCFVAAAAASSAEHVDFCNVNVRLLKQHYQQQQQQQKRQEQQSAAASHAAFAVPAEYANLSFRKRVDPGKRNKNKIELQLEHWENIGNSKNVCSSSSSSITDASVGVGAGGVASANVLSKGQRAATSSAAGSSSNFQQNVNAKAALTTATKTLHSNENDGPQLISHKNQQQHQNLQQQHHFSRSHCCFNNAAGAPSNNSNAAVTGTSGRNNNIRTSSSTDNINIQANSNNNRSNILHQQQKQQKQFSHDITVETTFQQQQQQRQLPLENEMQQQQQQHMHLNQHFVKQQQQQECKRDICSVMDQPNVTPKLLMLPTPPTATPRTALRSRLIQKRSDETSCSSFEQLNIVGIPTDDDDDDDGDEDLIGGVGFADEDDNNVAAAVGGITSFQHVGGNVLATEMEFDTGMLASAATRDGNNQRKRQEETCFTINERVNALGETVSNNPTTDFLSIYEEHEDRLLLPLSRVVNFSEKAHVQSQSRQTHRQQQQPDHDVVLLDGGNQRPLLDLPKQLQQQQQIQLQLHQNPHTRQLFGVVGNEMFPPKATPSCRSECELSGSYASLECPSPPGPPVCLPESRRDPQARLATYFRTFYTDLSLKEPIIPQWAIPVAPGALCAARLEPEIKLNPNSHGFSDSLTVDQILVSVQTKEGSFLEAPRRCLIECPAWTSRSNLCLRILHAWAKEPPWPTKGTPVAFALLIPLAEVKRSFAHYVEKELLPKGPLNPFANGIGGFSAAWNSLETLGPKLLIILDGYDSQKLGNPSSTPKKSKSSSSLVGGGSKHLYPLDVHDLLDGKLFPDARVIITTSTTNYPELLPIIQRHMTYEGLTWGRSACLLGGGQWGGPSRLLDAIQESVYLRKMVKTPLGCLAIATLYDTSNGDLPTDELDVVESVLNCVAPEASTISVAELGRLALFCLKMRRPCFTLAEMRMYCSTPESILLGCLDKNLLVGKSAKKKCEYVYSPICPGMMELLAANYIASLAARPGLLAAEITGMAVGDGELDADLLKVLKFSMTILGERAHILLSRLTPLWLTPQIVFTLALAGGHGEDNLAALCDILGISKHPPISPLETKPLWVQVRSVPTDLMGWGMALKSTSCTLKNLEVIYQLEKHNLLESRKAIEIFLDSIILNESVTTLRLSSLIEMDVKDSEISYLASCVSKLLLKPRLENFELVLTLLEEDPPVLKLQSVVAALCRTIPRQPRLSFLLLDLTFNTSQLVQLCSTLEKCPNVTRLSLPHLRCERGAITALASLLNSRPISFLSLPSCWGARDDPPSSSGVSMGSGSGSSTGTSGLIKQGSLPGVPSPRSYAPGIFSSLPRGVFIPQSSLGRSATLPRQPLEQTLDKRSCDSVVSKTWYPTPACDGGPHNSGTLHDLLFAARDSYSKLHGLDLSKAQLSLEDSMCLGETVRLSNTLHTLKLEGSSRLSEILPSVLGASESSCLQMLSIGSPRLSLEDSAIAMCARALTSCSTLRLLSLDGWNFRLENASTVSILRAFLSLTSIRELSLANCRLHISLVKSDTKISHEFECRSVVVLKLAGAQATLADASVIRGPQLLQCIGGFPCLRELDLSAPARSGLGSTHTTPLILDDKCIVNFFQNLHAHFSLLNTLKICNWVIHFDEFSKTLKNISKCMRNSPISHIKMDGISVLDRPKKQRSESNFVQCFISSLPQLRWMGISLAGKKEDHITAIGNAVLDLKGYEIDIKLSESTIEQAKLMAQAISLDGKFDIKVSTFGTSSGILVHAEKSGTKSLTRKNKD